VTVALESRRQEHAFAVGLYGLLAAVLLREVIFRSDRVVSADGCDLSAAFLPWSVFSSEELSRGHLPLWNPHTFSGAPFFGNLQSALLYPTTFLHLFLAEGPAFNVAVALHVVLAGASTYGFCRQRGNGFAGALLGGATFCLSAPYVLHLFPGHVTAIAVMAWAPVLFAVAEGLAQGGSWGVLLAGSGAVGLALLGGHPQSLYDASLFASLYLVLRVAREPRRLLAVLARWGAVFVAGCALAAPQLVAGAHAAREAWRSGGTSFDFATRMSLPPENLYTLLAPGLLGDNVTVDYLGGELLWEMSLFVGVTALILAAYGARHGDRERRRFVAPLAVLAVVLALGRYTPLFAVLHRVVPGLASFRVPARFGFVFALLAGALAAEGVDAVRAGPAPSRRWPLAAAGGACGAAIGALVVGRADGGPTGTWGRLLHWIHANRPVFVHSAPSDPTPELVAQSARFAAAELWLLGGVLALVAVALVVARRAPVRGAWALVVLGIGELSFFASRGIVWMPLPIEYPAGWIRAARSLPKEARVFDPMFQTANQGMLVGLDAMSGYDPVVSKRYGQFLHALEGRNPDAFIGRLELTRPSKAFALLRVQALLAPGGAVWPLASALPRAFLVSDWALVTGRDDAVRKFSAPEFDPARSVLLEAPPDPEPSPSAQGGSVRVTDLSTDVLEVVADVSQPALLVVTDTYSEGWRALAEKDSTQQRYAVVPADYIVRAVPLDAGHHHFRMEYRLRGLDAGIAVSIVAVLAWCTGLALRLVARRRLGA
jgi:hypothetical protein